MSANDIQSTGWRWSEEKNAEYATRLREYKNNPHHINPMSERFQSLLDEVVAYLSSGTDQTPSPYGVGQGLPSICGGTNHGCKVNLHPEYVTSGVLDV